MKLPVSMLRAFVTTSLSDGELGDLLTMAGFELEGMEEVEGESVLDIKVMANRGDGLSALGLAREVLAKDSGAAATDLYQRAGQRFTMPAESPLAIPISIEAETCTRFAARIFENVENGDSPEWLAAAMRRAGMRPISLLVDLTNFVMLELGQPLHAYDLALLHGPAIIVREARAGEKLTTLDGKEHELQPGMLMICDADRPVGVAGVMGGADTEVSAETKTCLLESAHFTNSQVRATRKKLGLNTDASYRFERSVDPEGTVAALNRFAELYAQITGKTCSAGLTDVRKPLPARAPTQLVPEKARELLGMPVTDEECRGILKRLGFSVSDGGLVTAPSWREDIVEHHDLVEEIGRVYGYERIPEWMPQGTTPKGGVHDLYSVIDTAKKTMLRCGLDQMMSHSLRDVHPLDFNPLRRVTVRNPHSPEMAYLRSSLLPGLAEAALRNGGRNLHLFEIGKVFVQGDYQIDESPELAILTTGELIEKHWAQGPAPVADFWSLKGIVVELGHLIRDGISFGLPRLPDHRFHPTRQAGVLVDKGRLWVGTIGQIHPDIAEQIGLPEETFMAELDLLVFYQNPDEDLRLKSISRNPAARRDIAVLFSKEVSYEEIEKAIADACGSVLEKQNLFDVYAGKGIPDGHHSLAINLQFRKLGENFTDEEANTVRDQAVKALEALGGKLR